MKMAEFKEIMRLSKWLKYFLSMLSVVAVAGVIASFALMSWADNKIETANLTFNGIDKGNKEVKSNENAYSVRMHFPRLDFLLRSKTIANVDITSISWAQGIETDKIGSIKSQNRYIKFITSQDLFTLNIQNLGEVKYKIDFSPLPKTIAKYFFSIALLAYLGFILYKIPGSNFIINKMLEFLKQNSVPQVLWQGYKNINPLYRHTFWIVFIACSVVFGFHTIHFLWGNHDWGPVLDRYGMFAEKYTGRWSQNIISMFLQDERLLPILNNLLAFGGISLASVLLCVYLNLPKKLSIWVIVGLVMTMQPFTLTRMYYAMQVAGLFIAVAIGILGFVLARKAGEYTLSAPTQNLLRVGGCCVEGGGGNKNLKPYILCLISIFCIHWSIASYQPFIDTALILLCGGIITIIIDNKGDLNISLYKSRFLIISVALSAISYKIVLDILKKLNITQNFYNNQMTPFSEIPERILLLIKTAFSNLVAYQYAFMPSSITYAFLAFLILLIALICTLSLKKRVKFVIFIFLILCLLATLTHIVLAKNAWIADAIIEYYGVMFWRVIIVALVFRLSFEFARNGQIVRNVGYILGVIVLWLCVVCDLHAQRMQKLAFDAHNIIINRVVTKIEENENFSYDKKYYFIMFGDIANMRHRYGAPYFDKLPKDRIVGSGRGLGGYGTLIPAWAPMQAFEFYMPKSISDGSFDDSVENYRESKIFQSLIFRLDKAGILDTLEPWPHKNSVVIFEDIIVFVASKGNLDEIKKMAKESPNKGVLQ